MVKVTTSIQIEESLRNEAKNNNIRLGETLEEALKIKLNKDKVIEEKKLELKIMRRKVRHLEKELKELEVKREKMTRKYGNKEKRREKAVQKLKKINDRQGFIDDGNIRAVSRISGLTAYEVEEIWKQNNM